MWEGECEREREKKGGRRREKVLTKHFSTSRKRDKQLEEEIRKASEEKESIVPHVPGRRSSSKSREGEKQRLKSTTSETEERPGPSIYPSTPFYTFVSISISQ